jgi:PadR family transcriptional regulator PadR
MGNDILGTLEQSVLQAIMRLRDNAYGVKIQAEIGEETAKQLSFGAIYTTLERLENKGFVKSRMGEATAARGGRAKKYFRLTGAGQTALHRSERAIAAANADYGMEGA